MRDVFVSYVEEDAAVAFELAIGLERMGFGTWCYQVDSLPGLSYLSQTGRAIDEAKVMVLVLSTTALGSQQVGREVLRGFEARKPFMPVLLGITHEEFQKRQPDWREMLGPAASIRVPPDGVSAVIPRMVQGLRGLRITAAAKPDAARVRELEAELGSVRSSGSSRASPPPPDDEHHRRHPAEQRGRRPAMHTTWTRVGVAGIAVLLLASIAFQISAQRSRTSGSATPAPAGPPTIPNSEGPLVLGVMDIHARGPVPEWMRDFTRDGLNTVLSKAPNLRVFSKQKIDFVREKRGLTEIEAAEQLGIAKMVSGTLTAREGAFVLEIEVVDIQSGLLQDSETVQGGEAQLVELQNRVAVQMVRAMKVALSTDDMNRMFARTNDSLDSYKMLEDTLTGAGDDVKPVERKPRETGAWLSPWIGVAWAEETGGDQAEVRQLLETYRAALEAKNLDKLAAVQEQMTDGQREALVRYFDNANGLKVQFSNLDILIEGNEALATFTRDDVFKDVRSGRDMHLEVRMSSVLAKQAGGWRIRALKKPS